MRVMLEGFLLPNNEKLEYSISTLRVLLCHFLAERLHLKYRIRKYYKITFIIFQVIVPCGLLTVVVCVLYVNDKYFSREVAYSKKYISQITAA